MMKGTDRPLGFSFLPFNELEMEIWLDRGRSLEFVNVFKCLPINIWYLQLCKCLPWEEL